jgi:hypothetical protein
VPALNRYFNFCQQFKLYTMANCYLNKYFTALVILMLALATSGHAMQQDTTAKGSTRPGMAGGLVLDEYGNPLKGVKVAVKGKADTARTDKYGRFEISAAANNTLVFKAANYNTREVAFKGSDVTVRLIDTYIKAPSKINVLYGTADADKNLGSISTIYTNQLTTTPATLYTYALPGNWLACIPSSAVVLLSRKLGGKHRPILLAT